MVFFWNIGNITFSLLKAYFILSWLVLMCSHMSCQVHVAHWPSLWVLTSLLVCLHNVIQCLRISHDFWNIGALSFVPIAMYTVFLFLLTTKDVLPGFPQRLQVLTKYILLGFIPLIILMNELASFLGISYRSSISCHAHNLSTNCRSRIYYNWTIFWQMCFKAALHSASRMETFVFSSTPSSSSSLWSSKPSHSPPHSFGS